MKTSIFKNREIKLLIFCMAAALFLLGLLIFLFNRYTWNQLDDRLIERNLSIIGNLLEKRPTTQEEIVSYFTKEPTAQAIRQGTAHASQYGYSTQLPISTSPTLARAYRNSTLAILIATTIILALIFCLLWIIFKRIYSKLDQLALGADSIMTGSFDIRFPEEGEGHLPLLGLQFNQMSKRLQLTLEELQTEREMLKNLMSDISHQLKTPLASLRVYNELLQASPQEPETNREFLEQSAQQLDRMEWLILSLLKISRLQAGVIEMDLQRRNLLDAIHEAAASLYAKVSEKRQTLHLPHLKKEIHLYHDSNWLAEAFRNLLKNAIDYTPECGQITIQVEETDSIVSVSFQDTGIGISPEELPHIFKRFYRGIQAKTASPNGSGIGIALSKLIIEKNGGYIQVRSKQNEGTTFTVAFPKSMDHLTKS